MYYAGYGVENGDFEGMDLNYLGAILLTARRTLASQSIILAEILVLVGGVILSAPAVSASTRICVRLKRVQGPLGECHVFCCSNQVPASPLAGG